jgi:hypothetical protein
MNDHVETRASGFFITNFWYFLGVELGAFEDFVAFLENISPVTKPF